MWVLVIIHEMIDHLEVILEVPTSLSKSMWKRSLYFSLSSGRKRESPVGAGCVNGVYLCVPAGKCIYGFSVGDMPSSRAVVCNAASALTF